MTTFTKSRHSLINTRYKSNYTFLDQESCKLRFASVFFKIVLLFNLTAWSTNVMSSGYTVNFEESYGKGKSPSTTSIISSPDGGYAFTGTWLSTSGSWIVKTDKKGQQQWEQSFQTSTDTWWERASVVAPTKDGGYLIGGQTDALDLVSSQWDDSHGHSRRPIAAYAAKIDKNGQVIWRKIFGKLGNYSMNNIFRVFAVDDGFIFLGQTPTVVTGQMSIDGKSLDNTVTIGTLWLFKINLSGEILWDKTLPKDGDEYLNPSLTGTDYSKLLVDQDRNIVFATAITEIHSDIIDGKKLLDWRGRSNIIPKKMLVIKLDMNGNELKRTRLPFGVDPTLIATSNGYRLLSNQVAVNPQETHIVGLQSVNLDADLNIASQQLIPSKSFWIHSAIAGPNGGLHLAGYHRTPPNDRGEAAIAFLSKEGEIRDEKLLGINSWTADLTEGASLDEAVFLWWGSWHEKAFLTKFKLTE